MTQTHFDSETSILTVTIKSNAVNEQLLNEIHHILEDVEHDDNRTKGIVFVSDKENIFLAGADLFHLNKFIDNEEEISALIESGQRAFNRISRLQIPTVAAIHGACLGGGYELALACDHRVASHDDSTKIGLPEVTLGVLPAWGGCTRLPKLLNLPTALQVILTGKPYPAKHALKLGLIDRLSHKEKLINTAYNMILKPKKRKRRFNWLPSSLVLNKANTTVVKKTSGNYPAPRKIIDVVRKSLTSSVEQSLEQEKIAFLQLCKTTEMRNLLRIFFLQEKSKKLKPVPNLTCKRIEDAVVVGAGTMGAGIAQWLSSRGLNVLLKDVNEKCVSSGLKTIGKLYVAGVLKRKFDRPSARNGLARVNVTTTNNTLRSKDILIEAIVEDLEIKRKALSQLESHMADDAIIATNTSALSINDMASCLKRPERFVGIHFFNPVHQMKLVEVVRGEDTSDEVVATAVRFVQQIGKLPVVVNDSPGFVVNRILVPYLVKAAQLLKDGAQIEAVDNAIVRFGMPMGPFRLMDEIGLDVCYHVACDLESRLGIKSAGISELVSRIGQKQLGKKTGHGFYRYKKGKSITSKVVRTVDVLPLIDSMTVEAQKVLDEGVIDDPNMLDFAMIMGTGWAPFHGGPIAYSTNSNKY